MDLSLEAIEASLSHSVSSFRSARPVEFNRHEADLETRTATAQQGEEKSDRLPQLAAEKTGGLQLSTLAEKKDLQFSTLASVVSNFSSPQPAVERTGGLQLYKFMSKTKAAAPNPRPDVSRKLVERRAISAPSVKSIEQKRVVSKDEDEEQLIPACLLPQAHTPGTLSNPLVWKNEQNIPNLMDPDENFPLAETAEEDNHIHHNDLDVIRREEGYTAPLPDIKPDPPVIRQRSAMSSLLEEFNRVQRELPQETCKVELVDSDIFEWEISLQGPPHSPYRLGTFRFILKFPPDYPTRMPRIRCATPVYHCNIDLNGTVCLGPFDENGLSPKAFAIDDSELQFESFRTKVVILIIGARGLRNADSIGKSDPYCACEVPGKPWARFETNVIQDDLNPQWNEEHVIHDYVRGDALDFSVWDSDDGNFVDQEPELLGKTTLFSQQFFPNGFEGDLGMSDAGKSVRASLRIKVTVIEPPKRTGRTTALDIIKALLSLLSLPVVDNALVPSVARLFQTNRREHDRMAQEWTLMYAK